MVCFYLHLVIECYKCFSHLIYLQVELGEKEEILEALQSKVAELKKCSQSQETPAKLQVLNISLVIFWMCAMIICMYS